MIPVRREKVEGAMFVSLANTYSGEILHRELINRPVRHLGEYYVCTSMKMSHSQSWCVCYSVVEISEWNGPVHIFGATDEEWFRRVKVTGQNWYGFRVCVASDDSGAEYILGRKIMFTRPSLPKARVHGQNFMGMK